MSYSRLSVKKETKEMLPAVRKEYLKHHPQHKDFRLSEDFLTKKAFEYYLKWI